MADKGKKRKAFEIPVLSELEEAVDVSPVFNRLKKTQNQAAATSNSRAKSTASENDVLKDWKLSIDLDRNPGLKDTDRDETVEGEEVRTAKEPDTVHVGRNFIETFAFIEKTKHYQEPKPLTTASNFCESASESTTKQEVPLKATNPNAVIISLRQKGNPVLKFFRNVPWEYGDIIPDYVMGPRMCALYLSVRYHNFNPDYIHDRLKKLGNRYELRILLVQVDTKDPHKTLKELTKIAILADCTLILAWSHEEVARYIEMYKIYENKPPDVLQGQTSTDYLSKLTDCLTTVKSVNRTDTVTLLSTFQTLESIISASTDDIALCPGFGPQKAKRLHDAFHQPFITSKTSSKNDRTGSKT